jgi:ABC-type transporter Mla subunit MlaD
MWNDVDNINSAIAQYKAQYDEATAAIANIDQQRPQLVKSQDTLIGAMAALDQLLQNKRDEEKAAADEMVIVPEVVESRPSARHAHHTE